MSELVAALEPQRAWVKRVLNVEVVLASDNAETSHDPAEVRDRLNELGLKLRELGALPEGADLRKRFAAAVAALKTGNLKNAMARLDEIEPLLVPLLSMARGKEAARVIGSAKAWRTAVATIAATLAGFKTSVIALLQADDHEPEEINDVGARLDEEITDITAKLSEGLADQVDAVINGDSARREAGMKTILAAIKAVETQIVTHEGVDAIEDNGVIPVQIREPAKAALDELRAALGEAVGQAAN